MNIKIGDLVQVGDKYLGVLESLERHTDRVEVTSWGDSTLQFMPGKTTYTLKVCPTDPTTVKDRLEAAAERLRQEVRDVAEAAAKRLKLDFNDVPVSTALENVGQAVGYKWYRDEFVHTKPSKGGRVKIRNKFYVGHVKVSSDREQGQDNSRPADFRPEVDGRWTHKTMQGAIDHAESILEANPKQDHCVVVQIVRVVRRKKLPPVVEVVR